MKPAMTADEWDTQGRVMGYPYERDKYDDESASESHRQAALALYGQTFGFTRDDVTALRQYAETIAVFRAGGEELADIADRIESLIPPH